MAAILALALGAVWTVGLGLHYAYPEDPTIASTTSPPTGASPTAPPEAEREPRYINMEGAAKSAFTRAKKWYGLSLAGSVTEPGEDAACPSHVRGHKGQLFWCQVLLEGHIVGVEMELISPLGFFRPGKVAENRSLWNYLYEEEVECVAYPASESAANCG